MGNKNLDDGSHFCLRCGAPFQLDGVAVKCKCREQTVNPNLKTVLRALTEAMTNAAERKTYLAETLATTQQRTAAREHLDTVVHAHQAFSYYVRTGEWPAEEM